MGIKTLLPFVKEATTRVNIKDFAGQVCAVDASCWLHKAMAVSYKEFGNDSRVIDMCESFLSVLLANDVKPYIVFDGLPLPAKQKENEKRARQRSKERENATYLTTLGDEMAAKEALAKSVEINYELVRKFVNICCERDISYIVAPHEADAQITFLVNKGYADFAVSEDSDLLAYQCNKVLFKLKTDGTGDFVELKKVLKHLNLDPDKFTDMCIAAGCDYVNNIRGIGINKAKKIVFENKTYLNVLQSLKFAPADYNKCFKEAQMVFHHQTVIDPSICETIPLKITNGNTMDSKLQFICGDLLPKEFVLDLAAGNIDPKNQVKKGSFDHLPMRQVPAFCKESDGDGVAACNTHDVAVDTTNAPWDIEILNVDNDTLPWTIPKFPVVTINFRKVKFKHGEKTATGLVNAAEIIAPTKYTCTKHCTIKLADKKEYTVLWELKPKAQPLRKSLDVQEEKTKLVGLPDENFNQEKHTLPFKVLGTCMSKERQTSLEKAYDFIENNRHVFVDLVPEPENTHDPNAIAVYILSQDEFEKVGYLPRELTCFIHPLIHTGDIEVEVKNIRFRTNYLRVGFYLSINITKAGLWDDAVVAASKNVR